LAAAEDLAPVIYEELKRLAAARMRAEAPGHTLQPTALVHEAWLRLGADQQPLWENRAHFFAAAAEAMRHGGQLERVDLGSLEIPLPMPEEEIVALDEALTRLADVDGRAAEVVKLCFFVGFT
jgi:RNA polymerase sigma factor (TIGR02999 family)